MESISFAGLIPIHNLDMLASQFHSHLQQSHLEKILEQPNVTPTSGFLCFIYAHLYEIGFKNQPPSYHQALKYYKFGVTNYLDPLCAYRLAEIYSQPQSAKLFSVDLNKNHSFCYLLLSTLIELYYDYSLIQSKKIIRALLKELDLLFITSYEIYQTFLKQFDPNTHICQMGDTFLKIVSYFFKSTNNQLHFYQDLILNCQNLIDVCPQVIIYQLFQIITHSLPTPNKMVSLILQILTQKSIPTKYFILILLALKDNVKFMTLCDNDSEQLANQRRIIFDITLFLKNRLHMKYRENKNASISQELYFEIRDQLKQCYAVLYNFKDKIDKSLHQSIIIRNYGKLIYYEQKEKGLEILKEDLNVFRNAKTSFGLIYYKLGKLQGETEKMMEKAQACFQERVKDALSSQFDKLIANYYLSKIFQRGNRKEEEVQCLKEIEDVSNDEVFSLVKTLQYQIIIARSQEKLSELGKCRVVEWNDEEFEIAMEQQQNEKISIEPIKYKIVLMNKD